MEATPNNPFDIAFFESIVHLRTIRNARYYVSLTNRLARTKDEDYKQVLIQCRRQVVDHVIEQDRLTEFQEMIVKYSGYDLKN
jgi:hypothetical protein